VEARQSDPQQPCFSRFGAEEEEEEDEERQEWETQENNSPGIFSR
jgi:hypothetical protein